MIRLQEGLHDADILPLDSLLRCTPVNRDKFESPRQQIVLAVKQQALTKTHSKALHRKTCNSNVPHIDHLKVHVCGRLSARKQISWKSKTSKVRLRFMFHYRSFR